MIRRCAGSTGDLAGQCHPRLTRGAFARSLLELERDQGLRCALAVLPGEDSLQRARLRTRRRLHELRNCTGFQRGRRQLEMVDGTFFWLFAGSKFHTPGAAEAQLPPASRAVSVPQQPRRRCRAIESKPSCKSLCRSWSFDRNHCGTGQHRLDGHCGACASRDRRGFIPAR